MHTNSLNAYHAAFDALQGRKRDVFNCLAMYGAMTDREVMDRMHLTEPNQVRPRITELIGECLAEEVKDIKCPVTGRTVRVVKAITECKPSDAQLSLL